MIEFIAGAEFVALLVLCLTLNAALSQRHKLEARVRLWRDHYETLAGQIDDADCRIIVGAAEDRIDAELREPG